MPRSFRRHPPAMLAASPSLIAAALGIRYSELAEAMRRNEIRVYKTGVRHKIFVRDALRWARRTWKPV